MKIQQKKSWVLYNHLLVLIEMLPIIFIYIIFYPYERGFFITIPYALVMGIIGVYTWHNFIKNILYRRVSVFKPVRNTIVFFHRDRKYVKLVNRIYDITYDDNKKRQTMWITQYLENNNNYEVVNDTDFTIVDFKPAMSRPTMFYIASVIFSFLLFIIKYLIAL